MSAVTSARRRVRSWRSEATDPGGLGYASLILLVLFVGYWFVQPTVFASPPQLNAFLSEGVVIAIAAMGTTIVIISGGFDLSVGSALSLVNVVVVTQVGDTAASQLAIVLVAIAVGLVVGLINGVLVAVLKIRSIVATLATFFLWGGVALLVLRQPGGSMPKQYVLWFTGYYGPIPGGVLVAAFAIGLWFLLARSALGRHIYAIGGNASAARSTGIKVDRTEFLTYVIAGGFYGIAGAFLTAQSASGDPNIGGPLLLTVYAALVVGGTPLGGGRGSAMSGLVGAFILVLVTRLLFAFGISSFYTPILTGCVLLAAVAVPQLRVSTLHTLAERVRGRPLPPTPGADHG